MKRTVKPAACLLALLCTIAFACALRAADDVPMKAMRDEMARSRSMQLTGLSKPYFIAYRIDDVSDVVVVASLGSLVNSQSTRSRVLHVELRVGDYKLDNTNFMSFTTRQVGGISQGEQIALDDNYKEIRRRIWLATDSQYKRAVELFAAKQAALQNQSHGDDIPDFSQEKPNKYFEADKPVAVDVASLEAAARQISAVFRQMPELESSQVTIAVHNVYTRYLNTEGTEYAYFDPDTSVEIKAATQGEDGIPINDTEQVFPDSPSKLAPNELTARAQQIVARLQKLRNSGTLDRYNGPVLFEGDAGAEIFAQLFAPGLIAARNPVTDNPRGQAFLEQMNSRFGGGSLADRIGGRVLPDFITLVDNPKLETYQGSRLTGTYAVDEDGVPTRVNTVVESGILKLVLNSRTPASGALESTGNHFGITAAPTNLILTASKSASQQELRRMLLERAKARGSDYGVVVRRAGGTANEFIQAAMAMAQGGGPSGNNMLEVVKLYPDGREELVHGVQLQSMTAASFKDIVAVGNQPVVYSTVFIPGFTSLMMVGLSGDASALSGLPVVSYVVPSLLFDDATLKKASGPFPKPPVTAAPPLNGN
ncbi:MAG TPA: metallopeptidase TldD-related protein [Candidatus Bathyarchaeia archaeon]|nr:metallopeptidase TldD-related protein [Candidatus Bathyarchaeia archaeon]